MMRRKSERTKSASSPVRSSERTSRRSTRRGKRSPTKSPEPAAEADRNNEDKVSETEVDGDNEKTRDSSTDRESDGRHSKGRRLLTRRSSRSDERSGRASRHKIESIQEEAHAAGENGEEASPSKGDKNAVEMASDKEGKDAKTKERVDGPPSAAKEKRRRSHSGDDPKKDANSESTNENEPSAEQKSVSPAKKRGEEEVAGRDKAVIICETKPDQEAEANIANSPNSEKPAVELKRNDRDEMPEPREISMDDSRDQRNRSRKLSPERHSSDNYERKPREQREHRKSKSDESNRSSDREHRNSRSSSGKDRSSEKEFHRSSRRSADGERSKEHRERRIRRSNDKASSEKQAEEKENRKDADESKKSSKDAETPSEKPPLIRKRRWLSRKTSETIPQVLAISTDSLKNLISDVEPVPLSDVKLESSPEPEITISKSPSVEPERIEKEAKVRARRDRERRDRRSRDREESSSNKREERVSQNNSTRKVSIVPDEVKLQRPPSPPRNVSSCILYITNLVRPFTLLQLKGLLARTGKIVENGFWMDRIKSQCYVKYETEDQAIETRHALHGVRWPTSNPKCLNVDFGTEEGMEKAVASTQEEAPRYGPENPRDNRVVGTGWDSRDRFDFDEKKEIQVSRPVREWDVGKKEEIEREMERNREQRDRRDGGGGGRGGRRHSGERGEREREMRERHNRSHSASPARKFRKKDSDPPLRLLDDLFRKTKFTPCIYWLPLTPDQIAEKEEARRKHMEDLEKRTEELRKEREREREQRERDREKRLNDREKRPNEQRRRSRSRGDRRRY